MIDWFNPLAFTIVASVIPQSLSFAFMRRTNFSSLPATFSAKAMAALLAFDTRRAVSKSLTLYLRASMGTLLIPSTAVS